MPDCYPVMRSPFVLFVLSNGKTNILLICGFKKYFLTTVCFQCFSLNKDKKFHLCNFATFTRIFWLDSPAGCLYCIFLRL